MAKKSFRTAQHPLHPRHPVLISHLRKIDKSQLTSNPQASNKKMLATINHAMRHAPKSSQCITFCSERQIRVKNENPGCSRKMAPIGVRSHSSSKAPQKSKDFNCVTLRNLCNISYSANFPLFLADKSLTVTMLDRSVRFSGDKYNQSSFGD